MSEAVADKITGRSVLACARRAEMLISVPAIVLLVLYFGGIVRIGSDEWQALGIALLGTVAATQLLLGRADRRALAPVANFFDDRDASARSPENLRAAYVAALRFPQHFCALRIASWAVGACVIPLGMALQGQSAWLLGTRLEAVFVYSFGGAAICCSFAYYSARGAISDARVKLAAAIGDSAERDAIAPRLSISYKLQTACVASVIGWLVLGLGVAHQLVGARLDADALAWQALALEHIEASLAFEREQVLAGGPERSAPFSASVVDALPARALWAYDTEFSLSRIDDLETAGLSAEAASALADELGADVGRGGWKAVDDGLLISWLALGPERVLVARSPTEDVGGTLLSRVLPLFFLLSFAAAGAILLGRMLARDIYGGVQALVVEADRVASGDLRPGSVDESDDELGDLARAFDRMRNSLRVTVSGVMEAADRVDATVHGIADAGQRVSSASREQAEQVRHAGQLMDRISAQVAGITGSAHQLGESVEESSSSILELGTAGEQLNDTASVLSEKIESVSSSIVQMVQSVQQVSDNTGGLADAASETSASMEEMASAMRAVDTTAERTAVLSTEVVDAAEGGQTKVRQTIEGMQAIQNATDAAEHVILGLGARAEEIGAILDVIEDVGDETTLLALNAAIIAAQAGEQGRAFSVVADEIKELAERVLASAKEIASLIRSVQGEVANAVGAIEAGSHSVASGVDLSAEAGGALEEITRAARESGSRIGEIVGAVREQTHAAVGVVELMDRVRDGVNEIRAAGVEQRRGHDVVLNSSIAIRDVAHQVRRTTEEQAAGFGRIRVSIEGVQEVAEKINGSLAEQSAACSEVARFLDDVSEHTHSNDEAMQGMGDSLEELARQAHTLRSDMSRFRI